VAATIFTFGCNFRCSFCHNPEIVKGVSKLIPEEKIWQFLKSRKKLLDAVCITGGEPTLQPRLINFIGKLKEMKFLVKLDTNGQDPELLQKLINKKLIDYVAMDIKAPWDKYNQVVCRKIDLDKIRKSVKILMRGKIDYEFRSTIVPSLHSFEDILEMANQIKGAKKYFLQQFRPTDSLMNPLFSDEKPYSRKDLNEIHRQIKDLFPICKIR
ncbi:MAG: anaerobic ribonucleoside-triphosphate reductase activating protein, partial [Patescibacteria group bacterium]